MKHRLASPFRAVLLLGLALLGVVDSAAAATESAAMAPVVLDGRVLFRVARSGNYSAEERACLINDQLAEQASTAEPSRLDLALHDGMSTIRLDGRHLLTVMDADVLPGKSPAEQTRLWLRDLDAALQRAKAERSTAHLRSAVLRSLALLLFGVTAHWLLRRAARRLPLLVARRFANQAPAPGRAPARHAAIQLAFVLAQCALWAAIAFAVTDLFPILRGTRYSLLQLLDSSLTAPILTLEDRHYSAFDALWLVTLVAALWIGVSVLTRVLKSRLLLATGAERKVVEPAAVVAQYGLTFVGLIVILQSRGLDLSSLTIPASVVGVGIGFGLQNIANNFVSGLIISFERPVQVGDFVQVGELSGSVDHIGARSTAIRTTDALTIIVPNSRFLEDDVINWSHGDPLSRLHLPVGVAFGSDIQRTRAALLEAAMAHPEVVTDPRPEVHFAGFGDNALNLELLVWTRDPRNQSQLKSDLYYRIDANLRRHGLDVPFPQRTLHIPPAQIEQLFSAWKRLQAPPGIHLYYPNGEQAPPPPATEVSPPMELRTPSTPVAAFDLEGLVARMHGPAGLEIKDRRHLLSLYPKCFLGSEAVAWMMRAEGLTREEAVRIGRTLVDRRIIHHVLDEHSFKDEHLFYRFYADEMNASGAVDAVGALAQETAWLK